MKVFAEQFLEANEAAVAVPLDQWSWKPRSSSAADIYASGAKTATRASTYADDRDNNSDSDRPNEGP
jgi:hypothetical protein